MKRKRRINAPKYTRSGTPITVHDRDRISPVLLKQYQDIVHKKLEELGGLTVLEALYYVPTLEHYVKNELDRWYIIYKANLETSVFKETATTFGEDDQAVRFGKEISTSDGEGWLEEIAGNYAEIIKKISLHNQMLQMMVSADFPGKKVE